MKKVLINIAFGIFIVAITAGIIWINFKFIRWAAYGG